MKPINLRIAEELGVREHQVAAASPSLYILHCSMTATVQSDPRPRRPAK